MNLHDLDFWKMVVSYNPKTGDFTWLDFGLEVYEYLGKKAPSGFETWSKKRTGRPAGYLEGGYRVIEFAGQKARGHRLAWAFEYGSVPTCIVDHINGVKSDNSIGNLRLADAQQNSCNRQSFDGAMSLYLGVQVNPDRGLYRAEVRTKLGQFRSSWFEDEEDAAEAYNEIAPKLNGEFARLNIIGQPGKTVSAITLRKKGAA